MVKTSPNYSGSKPETAGNGRHGRTATCYLMRASQTGTTSSSVDTLITMKGKMTMMKHEFETLALRNDAEIGVEMYAAIERFYISDNEYHEKHGGVWESKRDFVRRVFGGKVNTPKTIAEKIAAESIKENRWALRGLDISKTELDRMDSVITDHYMTMYRHGW